MAVIIVPVIRPAATGVSAPTVSSAPPIASDAPAAVAWRLPGLRPSLPSKNPAVPSRPWPPNHPNSFWVPWPKKSGPMTRRSAVRPMSIHTVLPRSPLAKRELVRLGARAVAPARWRARELLRLLARAQAVELQGEVALAQLLRALRARPADRGQLLEDVAEVLGDGVLAHGAAFLRALEHALAQVLGLRRVLPQRLRVLLQRDREAEAERVGVGLHHARHVAAEHLPGVAVVGERGLGG